MNAHPRTHAFAMAVIPWMTRHPRTVMLGFWLTCSAAAHVIHHIPPHWPWSMLAAAVVGVVALAAFLASGLSAIVYTGRRS